MESLVNHPLKGDTIGCTCAAVFVSLVRRIADGFAGGNASDGNRQLGTGRTVDDDRGDQVVGCGAYFTGQTLGRHKLIPRLSPGKTWEGARGGCDHRTIVAFVCLTWLFPAVAAGAEPPG